MRRDPGAEQGLLAWKDQLDVVAMKAVTAVQPEVVLVQLGEPPLSLQPPRAEYQS